MKKLLLIFIIIMTWMVVGCGTSTGGCFGHWVKGPGHHRGTRALLKDAHLPYYQCVDAVSYTHLTLPTKRIV